MERNELADLLESEGLLDAAADVRGGGDVAAICARVVQEGSRYEDGQARYVMVTCRKLAEYRACGCAYHPAIIRDGICDVCGKPYTAELDPYADRRTHVRSRNAC